MHINNDNKKYFLWGITAFVVISLSICFFFCIFKFSDLRENVSYFFKLLTPVWDGLLIAYLLSPILTFLEKKLFYGFTKTDSGKKKTRVICIILTMLIVSFLFYAFFVNVIPELSKSISSIRRNFPYYQKNLQDFVDKLITDFPELSLFIDGNYKDLSKSYFDIIANSILPKIDDGIIWLTSGVYSAVRAVLNFILGIIMAVYLLYNKETFLGQSKKVIYAFFKRRVANSLIHNLRFTNKTFQNFIVGKIVDSIIVGIICFIVCKILGTPYTTLISVIIGITNIIPLFGPFIGAIPSAILILMVDPKQCLYFIIMIIVLQQVDGNIIGPKILGSSTGISGFWVIFAITLFGGLFGVAGWVIGVPLFAVIYTGIKALINGKLEDKGLKNDTKLYIDVNYIDDNKNYISIPKSDIVGLATRIKNRRKSIRNDQESNNINNSSEDISENKTEEENIVVDDNKKD